MYAYRVTYQFTGKEGWILESDYRERVNGLEGGRWCKGGGGNGWGGAAVLFH